MTGYKAFNDPYCYKGTFVLKNRGRVRDQSQLEAFELEMTTLRAEEPLPLGRFGPTHYRAVHKHLFQDVYPWAGRYRTVRTSKGGNVFCYPENIASQMNALFRQTATKAFIAPTSGEVFIAAAATFLSELNAIHPFREGNGRAQLAFLYLLALRAGHPIDLTRIRPAPFLAAMIRSFSGPIGSLTRELNLLRLRA